MIGAARRAPAVLGESASLVANFLHEQLAADGGFAGPDGKPDLYYTVFGIDGLMALGGELPHAALSSFVRRFGDGEGLDLVHLACLARCRAALADTGAGTPLLARIESHRSADGGYARTPGAAQGTAYACFLALGAWQDLAAEPPEPEGIVRCLDGLRTPDGGYANEADVPVGSTPATAAAACSLRHLGAPVDADVADWLLARHGLEGGFRAVPIAPVPDLLSTATALHALAGLGADVAPVREACLDFVDSLWSRRGAFCGTTLDRTPDCEYTFYGLLALGHLAR